MKFPVCLTIITLAAFACSAKCLQETRVTETHAKIANSVIYTIVNGFPTFNKKFFVKLYFDYDSSNYFGGALIDPQWVITSAVCLRHVRGRKLSIISNKNYYKDTLVLANTLD